MGYSRYLVALVLVALAADKRQAGQPTTPPISVRIVPMTHHGHVRAIDLYRKPPRLYVAITNTSEKTVRLWEDWNSWGYYNLSFVLDERGGKPVVVKKKPRGWDKNFPSEFVLPPGDHMVLPVTFDAEDWEGFPTSRDGKPRSMKLKAVYRIEPEAESEKYDVWTGEVASPEDVYTVYGPNR